jgi:anthranilate synthase/aminodeoxychorismate synthase-like glutamine amidotransferase
VILLLDNHDSFVYNLARYVRELGDEPLVRRCDSISLEDIATLKPSHIILSPGPGSPADARLSVATVNAFGATTPILGVCLGHQCIGAAYGALIVPARTPMHGKVSGIWHDGTGVFAGVPQPFPAARYHSLAISVASVPRVLRMTATAGDGEVMAVAHVSHPVVGLQFHPESVLTSYGYQILDTFLHGGLGARSLPSESDGIGPQGDAARGAGAASLEPQR